MPTASELSQRRRSTAFRCQWTNPLARTSARPCYPQFPCVSCSCAAKTPARFARIGEHMLAQRAISQSESWPSAT